MPGGGLVRPFWKLPSPRSWPLVGHAYLFLPVPGGGYSTERLTEAVMDLSRRLGPVFRLRLGGRDMVVTTDAEDARTMYRHEGAMPRRPTFPALLHLRTTRYASAGVVPSDGDNWRRLRSGVNALLQPAVYRFYQSHHNHIAQRFVDHLRLNRTNDFIVENIFTHLLKYAIEAISIVSPGYHIKCLKKEGEEKSKKIINASVNFMDGLYSTLTGSPTWKLWRNHGYRQLQSAHHYVHGLVQEHLQRSREQLGPFLRALLDNNHSRLSHQDVVMLSMETFLAGIDATATALTMVLHYLSMNEDAQEHVRQDSTGTEYAQACLREALRLAPTAGANSRFLHNDCVLQGYHVPAGTLVSVFSSVTCHSEHYFHRNQEFVPERWLRSSQSDGVIHHPFASLPFGHGPRMCPGRRLALQEMSILLQELLANFRVIPVNQSPLGMIYRMNRVPDRPLHLRFLDIKGC